ncbi:MAG: polyprenyl synthetase family protein [Armatimonadota bacterium]|nr:polyprenyl synthetase family protein [Armatimonadota bacterium]
MDFESFSKLHRPTIDERLAELLPSEDERPESLHRAMRYAVLSGGKRLRPLIALALAEAVGDMQAAALDAACAVELVHCFSLIHDDLPMLDNDDLRRGMPTVHIAFSEPIALLAGDALFALAFETLARTGSGEAVALLAEASGTRGMVGGQTVDVECEGTAPDLDTIEWIHRRKTGALFEAAAGMGALFGGGSAEQVVQARAFGADIGLAFQIADDVLDETGSTESLGKRSQADRDLHKATYPASIGVDGSRELARQSAERALERLEGFPNPDTARNLARFAIERGA